MNFVMDYINKYSFALYQNDCSLIKKISIENNNDNNLENISLKIDSEPEFLHCFTTDIEMISPREIYILEHPALRFNFNYLESLKERLKGNIHIQVFTEDEILHDEYFELNIYPMNDWHGVYPVPELIAAYIDPNNDEVIKILKTASIKLKEQTSNSAINGYQSNSKERVWKICSAIYNSIHELGITYSNPPASFENAGQKIRTTDDILRTKFATCLDITLLYCACLEQAGLNPVVLLKKGHAYSGVWLEEIFTEKLIEPDLSFFEKSYKINDLIAIETTLLTNDEFVTFDKAVSYTEKYYKEKDNFIFGVDITGARVVSKIRPVNSIRKETDFDNSGADRNTNDTISEKTFLDYYEEDTKVKRRIDIWKSRLLDLSLRNNFINYKETQNTIRLLCPNPEKLEDELNNSKSYKVLGKPELNISHIRDSKQYENRTNTEFDTDVLKSDLNKLILHTAYTENDTNKRLLNLYRKQKLSEEESGTNTLYLSLGFLQWKETDKSKVLLKSPIILVPVELIRKSIIDGYTLRLRDDEPIINFTLLEKLENDFGIKIPGIDPLPEDDSGVDVGKVWYLFRKQIKTKVDWNVLEEVWLGHFSFKKFLMWRDLHENQDSLSDNKLVKRILEGEKSNVVFEKIDLAQEHEVDTIHPSEMILPLSADSSQIAAILSVRKGKNLIIQGPPGTGKSQTITNLIANSISSGKTVLFVSEKKVALEVVFKRLKDICLEPFCLELHSNKSQKGEVIQSFKSALDFRIQENENAWEYISNNLHSKKTYLNDYVTDLHQKRDSGFSIYESYGIHTKHNRFPEVIITSKSVSDIKEEEYLRILDKLKNIRSYCAELNLEDGFVFKDCKISEFNFDTIDQLGEYISSLFLKIDHLLELLKKLQIKISIPDINSHTFSTINIMKTLFELLLSSPEIPGTFINMPQWKSILKELKEYARLKDDHDSRFAEFTKACKKEFLNQDLQALRKEIQLNNNSWFLAKFFKNNKLLKKQKVNFTTSDKFTVSQVDLYAEKGIAINQLIEDMKAYHQIAERTFGVRWNKLTVAEIPEYLNSMDSIISTVNLLTESINSPQIKEQIKKLFDEGILSDSSNQTLKLLKDICAVVSEIESAYSWISDRLVLEPAEDFSICDITEKLSYIDKHKKDIRYWASIQQEAKQIIELGFTELFDNLFSESFSYEDLIQVFKFNFHNKWLKENLNSSQVLRSFSSVKHHDTIAEFHELDCKHQQQSVLKMINELLKNKPVNSKMVTLSSPISIINKESLKKRKQKSIRNFLYSIEPIMNNLKPCMLMSPLSVAQYLPARQIFDLIIFDEASQITPWDAIGAIGRGKQVVVVGDSKQLPPTNLFTKSISEDFMGEEYEDLESILDECQKHLDNITLRWHYRSRHESLIAFSNRHIYSNKLNTFPSNSIEDKAVSFRFIKDGIYDRGRSRTNKKEALAVVKQIIEFLRHGITSIGVITFNQNQSNKIEDLLYSEVRKHPELDELLSNNDQDSIFIKNIENVQGDERDIILFSMTFGYDELGVMTQRFSSLNSVGGHRRLNVAITRARERIIVFSSIRKENIDLKKSKYLGVKLLREFLNYAEQGASVSFKEEADSPAFSQFDSPFEEEVYTALTVKNWNVISQVGVGNYRIDIGVTHPDKPGVFLAGIECDGRTYHNSRSARDRDILRQQVLENMGWKILRIWSTDWFYDKDKIINDIDKRLTQLLVENNKDKDLNQSQASFNSLLQIEESDFIQEDQNFSDAFGEYEEADIEMEYYYSDEFYWGQSQDRITYQLNETIEKEAPILKEELYMKIYKSWGLTRGGSRVNRILDSLSAHVKKDESGRRTFFWKDSQNPDTVVKLRTSGQENKRNPKVICPQEIAYGFIIVLEHNHAVHIRELYRKVNEILGWKKLSKSTENYYEEALKFLVVRDKIHIDDEDFVSMK